MDKNRPIVVATLGYIIGIIWGLYFNKSIVSCFVFIIIFIMLAFQVSKFFQKSRKKFQFFSLNKILRYIKLILNIYSIIIIIVFSSISNLIVLILNNKYENLYSNLDEVHIIAKVMDNGTKKDYSSVYKIQVEVLNNNTKYKKTNLYLRVNNNINIDLEYGDKIQIQGNYIEPDIARNYKGFDYSKYLRNLEIYGTVKADKIRVIEKDANNLFSSITNNIFLKIVKNLKQNLSTGNANLLLGILFGYTDEIPEDTKEAFKQSNISHILAVSGMHISYIILAITSIAIKSCGKRNSPIITIIFIIGYMFITNFTPSVTRAGIMGIIMLIAKITHNKNDIWTSICMSLLIILIWNPYLITNAGVLLSYGGTIGILLFRKTIIKIFNYIKSKNKFYKYKANRIIIKITDYIEETLSVSISAQIVIAPIMIQMFNTFGITFFITNFFVSFIIGPIIIIGFLFIISIILYQHFLKIIILNSILKLIYNILKILIENLLLVLNLVAKLGEILPLSSINVITLPMWIIVIYYIFALSINQMYKILNKKDLTAFEKRLVNWKNLIKHRIRKNKKTIIFLITLTAVILCVNKNITKDLCIYFVDVGQGDCSLIITPQGKKILIDGGGSESYDVGKNTLLPYLLDRQIIKIDYMIISHFDTDHVGGLLTILKELNVDKVIIGKQYETSENYEEFLKIIKEKRIAVKNVRKGEKINIEKDIQIEVLFPEEELLNKNALNNNSIVFKLVYKKFSMLFTGDIEEYAEQRLIKLYRNTNVLSATVLKIAHHGSKSSSILEFLELVKPKIALIGVGKNNTFGHPNKNVIERLQNSRCQCL